MARLAQEIPRKEKFKVRQKNRCPLCGRSRSFLRKFQMCRLCFRMLALRGDIPGVIKSSW
jgi:small subunit ribosomal protein S14